MHGAAAAALPLCCMPVAAADGQLKQRRKPNGAAARQPYGGGWEAGELSFRRSTAENPISYCNNNIFRSFYYPVS